MKLCPKCKELKDNSDFSKNKTAKDRLAWQCKECVKKYRRLNRYKRNEYNKKYNRTYRGKRSMLENKECACYLGMFIAEGLVAKYFKNPIRMPAGNPGYDFICSKGYKVDVKSSVLTKYNSWSFDIRKNKIADYFLCLAYDNRQDLNLIHIWLFPGHIINNMKGISSTQPRILKWAQYEKPIEKIGLCCETLKKEMT